MVRKKHTTEQIIGYLRQAEMLVGQDKKIEDMPGEMGITEIANSLMKVSVNCECSMVLGTFDMSCQTCPTNEV